MRYDQVDRARWTRDYESVQKSLQGDTQAWDVLYLRAYDVVMRKVSWWNQENVLTAEDIQEIAEEALLRCYRKRSQFRAISMFSTWACGFAAYVTLDYKRKRYRQLMREGIYSYDPPEEWKDLDAYLIRKERDFCLWLAYDSLAYNHRILIGWRELEWYGKEEARKLTGIRRRDMEAECDRAVEMLGKRFHAVYRG